MTAALETVTKVIVDIKTKVKRGTTTIGTRYIHPASL
jgi:hypothetical protein